MATIEELPAGAERRSTPRFPIILAGRLWLVSRNIPDPFPVTSVNISLGGMLLTCPPDTALHLDKGDLVVMGFSEPETEDEVTLKGRVAWTSVGLMGVLGRCALGVAFTETPEPEIRRLLDPASGAPAS